MGDTNLPKRITEQRIAKIERAVEELRALLRSLMWGLEKEQRRPTVRGTGTENPFDKARIAAGDFRKVANAKDE